MQWVELRSEVGVYYTSTKQLLPFCKCKTFRCINVIYNPVKTECIIYILNTPQAKKKEDVFDANDEYGFTFLSLSLALDYVGVDHPGLQVPPLLCWSDEARNVDILATVEESTQ